MMGNNVVISDWLLLLLLLLLLFIFQERREALKTLWELELEEKQGQHWAKLLKEALKKC